MTLVVPSATAAHGGAVHDALTALRTGGSRSPERERAETAGVPVSFFDRDLSQLRFHRRVLDEAQDETTPLLERVRFLSIVGTNLDDFVSSRGPACRVDAAKRLLVESLVTRLLRDASMHWHRALRPALAAQGLPVVGYDRLDAEERQEVDEHFARHLRHAVRPCSVDRASDGALEVPGFGVNFVVVAQREDTTVDVAILRVPDAASPLVPFRPSCLHQNADQASRSRCGYVWLDEVIEAHLADVFPNQTIVSAHRFRVIRQAEAPSGGAPVTDPLAHAASVVRARDGNPVVALVMDRRMPATVQQQLARALQAPVGSLYRVPAVINPQRYWEVSRIARPDLCSHTMRPEPPEGLGAGADLFAEIRRRDILLHHPFESFEPVIALIRQAAADPDVLRMSITLYRTDRESLVAHALLEALRRGKQVRVVVELHARLDEARNITLARDLAHAGAQVSFGHPALKVHAKMAVIERREGASVRRYAHVSSGNYHAFNARTYTDLSLLTCDAGVAEDIDGLFSRLAGGPGPEAFRAIRVAPLALRQTLTALIDREIEWAARGDEGRIVLKTNALLDEGVIRHLYRASQSGVTVDLIVRGMCALRPGVPGLSERITVRSIVGRFLEHSRVWYFRNGGHDDVYIGSADVRTRNFDRRVEVMVPMGSPAIVARIRDEILARYLADNVNARMLRSDGVYVRPARAHREPAIAAQRDLLGSQKGDT